MTIRTDLAMEAKELSADGLPREFTETFSDMTIRTMTITNEQQAEKIGKAKGTYITVEFSDIAENFSHADKRITVIGNYIRKLLPPTGTILVVGLGNRNITPDALGGKSVGKVIATRHIRKEIAEQTGIAKLRRVAVITPGVSGQTGIESCEFILSIANKIKPSGIIVVDALASRRLNRLGCTLQISDTGITPGSGVNNHRFSITEKALGIPVIAIGIPTVVDALTLAYDIVPHNPENFTENVCPQGRKMVVTPQNIDVLIEHGSELIGLAINSALYETLTLSEIVALSS
ncbi:MAG: GPR endopeptidase [Clostridia bacterium]|nr:GPR endopeptidase [Clostridia bacterium]